MDIFGSVAVGMGAMAAFPIMIGIAIIMLLAFIVLEYARLKLSHKRKRRAEVLARWRRIKRAKKKNCKKTVKKPLWWRVAHLRKKRNES